jgi:hypothetical protein
VVVVSPGQPRLVSRNAGSDAASWYTYPCVRSSGRTGCTP